MTTLCFRNWYSQESTIVQCFKSNYKLAEKCWSKVIEEDLTGVGECLSSYWEIKRTLAPGSEPQLVRSILDTLEPFIVGGSLAGAGGGGFLAAILREGADKAAAVEEVRCVQCRPLASDWSTPLILASHWSGDSRARRGSASTRPQWTRRGSPSVSERSASPSRCEDCEEGLKVY